MEGDSEIKINVKLKTKPFEEILRKRGLEDNGRVQRYIDSEVIRLMEDYTPYENGDLINSALLLTKIGSGEIRQGGAKAPYARKWYYYEKPHGSMGVRWSNGLLRGSYWFERMKQNGGKKAILQGAIRESGAKK